MRPKPPEILERARFQQRPYVSTPGEMCGMFEIRGPGRYKLRVLSSGAARSDDPDLVDSWEHVSVSVKGKRFCPTWEEMCFVKRLFWHQTETVIEYHPPESEYVDTHGYTLHLWKPPFLIRTPPAIAVGLKGVKLTG